MPIKGSVIHGNKSSNWSLYQLPFEEALNRRFLGHSKVCSEIAGILASQKVKGQGGPSLSPRILIVGPTSSGKTELARLMVEFLKVPSITMSMGTVTPESFKGAGVMDGIQCLLKSSNKAKVEQSSVIVCDELCKLIRRDGKEQFIQQIQHSLLPILGGETVQVPSSDPYRQASISFNSKNSLIVLMGVFPGVPLTSWSNPEKARRSLNRYGFSEEFCSRITHFIQLRPLAGEQFKKLVEKEAGQISELYRTKTFVPRLTSRQVQEITKKVIKSPFGFRSSRSYIHQLLFKQAKKRAVENIIS